MFDLSQIGGTLPSVLELETSICLDIVKGLSIMMVQTPSQVISGCLSSQAGAASPHHSPINRISVGDSSLPMLLSGSYPTV